MEGLPDEGIPVPDAGDNTDEHEELIEKLRERISSELPSENNNDHYLRKWLIARNYDLDRAEEMLKKHLEFWKINGLDKIGEDYTPIEVSNYFHTARLGYDNEGSVVRILHLGASDLKGLTLSLSKMDSTRTAVHTVLSDILTQKRERSNLPLCDKQVYIFDMQGLNWMSVISRAVVDRAFYLLKYYEANYPECLKIVYIVNAPSFFNFIWNWLKTVLPTIILSKINVLSPENCKETLSKHIDPSILPASLGGTKVDQDGNTNCPSLYKMPLNILVPDSYYLANQISVLDKDPNAIKHLINCGSSLTLKVDVTEANSSIEWDFQTMFYDISFALSFRETDSAPAKEIIPFHRVDSHLAAESGNFVCPDVGVYEIIFDNSYSWMTKKELIYKISLKPPNKT